MTLQVPLSNPAGSGRKLNVSQSSNPNAMSFVEPGGDPLTVTLHAGNTVTISEGDAVSTGPGLPENS